MEPEPSTRNNTATKTQGMFDETPPLSKNIERPAEKRILNL